MRILLISGIVFVHVPHDPQTSPFTGDNGFLDWIRVFLGDSLFRVGVPCLSAISGYLLFRRGLDAFDYGKTIRSKARTVLLPFLIWNLTFLLLVLVAQRSGIGFGYLPDTLNATPRDLATLATAIEAAPINIPLYFLRDLLLCILLSPLLAVLIKRFPLVTLSLFLIYVVFPVPNGIFLKKSILFGFSCGIYVSLHKVDVRALDAFAGRIGAMFLAAAVILATLLYWTGPDYPVWVDILRSLVALCGIIGSWAISLLLIRSSLGIRLSKLEGLSFWIFCAHYPLLILFWMVWNRAGDADFYPLFYFSAPILALVILTVTHSAARGLVPRLHAVLTGSRVGSKATQTPARTVSPPRGSADKDWQGPYPAKKEITR
ncbi:acyltransferase (plasmid) [Rhizobium sp. 32-5/1]|uniref:acyltransferase family protein n=1 Tax=Rhizobium sp. 32-5/1 TaxID=3019602 RepID=UPI00240D51D7|nr:acyltransferase [Rhizobium sp. 32-5/1]WEZ85290.1 acyltransferase [Rhizobium sp. 32-5/1]